MFGDLGFSPPHYRTIGEIITVIGETYNRPSLSGSDEVISSLRTDVSYIDLHVTEVVNPGDPRAH